jgi:hypothetical protein
MPRKKRAAAPEPLTEPVAPPPDPSCNQCRITLTWRDHAYGAAAKGLCKRCNEKLTRQVLRGAWQLIPSKQGMRPNTFQGPNRAARRDAQFGRQQPQTLRRAA